MLRRASSVALSVEVGSDDVLAWSAHPWVKTETASAEATITQAVENRNKVILAETCYLYWLAFCISNILIYIVGATSVDYVPFQKLIEES
jgi:hypothetical protein